MKKYIYIALAVLGLFIFASCENGVKSNNWGQTVYYRDFLFKKCPADTLTKTLVVSFNEESMKMPEGDRDLVLSLYRLLDDGSVCKVSPDEAVLLVGGKLSDNNTFAITPDCAEQRIKIGVVMTEAFLSKITDDQIVSYMFKVDRNPGYERLNNLNIAGNKAPLLDSSSDEGMQVRVFVDITPNSLKVWTIIGSIIFLVALILWIALAHLVIWPSTRFSKVLIDYHDGIGERPIRTGGCYQLVLTDDSKLKDSFLKKIFMGKCKYEVHPFWTHQIIIKNSASRMGVRVVNLRSFGVSGETLRKQPFEIYNDNGDKVTITTT